jgi:hypothetical protein
MTDDDETPPFPPAAFAQGLQNVTEQAVDQQQRFYQQLLSGGDTGLGMSLGTATFKARVQSGGRISIPDAEREALDIGEGDLVQTIVVPIKRSENDDD